MMRTLGSTTVDMLHSMRDMRDIRGMRPARLLGAAALAMLAACGGSDGTAPGTTHPTIDATAVGASADRLQAITTQPVISAVLAQGSSAGLPSFARGVARLPRLMPRLMTSASRLTPSVRLSSSQLAPTATVAPRLAPRATLGDPTALIPDTLLGKTLVPDASGLFTVSSSLTGAPSNGVRFMVRTPGTTQDIGYADLTENVSAATSTLTLDVKTAAGLLVMHNVESTTISGSDESDAFSGYATNGTDRMDYAIDIQTVGSRTTATITLGSPSANVAVADSSVLDGMTATDVHVSRVTIGSTVVRITTPAVVDPQYGGYIESDTSKVTVNGAAFATIAVGTSGTPSITAPDGSALSPSDMSALASIEGIMLSTATVILTPVIVVLWLLIATSGF